MISQRLLKLLAYSTLTLKAMSPTKMNATKTPIWKKICDTSDNHQY